MIRDLLRGAGALIGFYLLIYTCAMILMGWP